MTTFWGAIVARYDAEVSARRQAIPTSRHTSVAVGGPRPPVEMSQLPDGRTRQTYNMWSYAASQPKSDKPLR